MNSRTERTAMTDTNRAEPMKKSPDEIRHLFNGNPLAAYEQGWRDRAAEVEASRLPQAGAAPSDEKPVYLFWINDAGFSQAEPTITGRAIKALAFYPPEYGVWRILPGPIDPPVGDDEAVDLRGPEARFLTGKRLTTQGAPSDAAVQQPVATLTFYPFPQAQPRGGVQLLLITTSKVFWKGDLYRGEQWRIDGDPGWNGKRYEHALKNLSDVIFWAELPDAVELANAALGNRTPARQEERSSEKSPASAPLPVQGQEGAMVKQPYCIEGLVAAVAVGDNPEVAAIFDTPAQAHGFVNYLKRFIEPSPAALRASSAPTTKG